MISSAPAAAPPPAAAAREDAVTLSVFTVSDEKDVGYESMQTTSGMRTVQELRNVANSISVMNSQLIEDLGALNIEEMSRWFVTGEQSPDPAQPNQLVFRGVRNSYALRNGWIWYSPMDSFSTERVEELREMVGRIDSAKTTTNLWGERWSKLCQNGMKNGVSAATGLTGADCDRNDAIRRFSIKLGGEAVRVFPAGGARAG